MNVHNSWWQCEISRLCLTNVMHTGSAFKHISYLHIVMLYNKYDLNNIRFYDFFPCMNPTRQTMSYITFCWWITLTFILSKHVTNITKSAGMEACAIGK
jgi:hypothetical protein